MLIEQRLKLTAPFEYRENTKWMTSSGRVMRVRHGVSPFLSDPPSELE